MLYGTVCCALNGCVLGGHGVAKEALWLSNAWGQCCDWYVQVYVASIATIPLFHSVCRVDW